MEKCRCWDMGLRENMTWDELMETMVRPENYCTSLRFIRPGYICPTLDKELRRADAERTRMKYYQKRKKKEGYTDDELKTMKPRRKGNADAHAVELDLENIV